MGMTEQDLLDQIADTSRQAGIAEANAGYDYNRLGAWPTAYSSQQTQWSHLRNCLADMLLCIEHMVGQEVPDTPLGWDAWAHYMLDFWPPTPDVIEPEPLSWEDIVTAWADASKVGRLFTVLTIDEMRKTVWQEEFQSFHLKAAGEQ